MMNNDATENPLTIIHRDIFAAAMILTRLPVVWPFGADVPNTARSYWAFPLIGIGVAAFPALIAAGLLSFGVPALASATLMILGIIVMTGGLHQDGLADLGDSFGGRDPEHRLEIMHDSSIGSYGTLTLITAVIINVSCLAAIGTENPQMMAQVMVGVAAMSRGMMALQRWQYAPPNADGLASATGAPDQQVMLIGLLLSFLAGVVFMPAHLAIFGFVAGLIATMLLGRFLKFWIGGVNGDGLGATQQISQTVMLLFITLII
jgi:adenosylcobinamide-GDP ribazoletransferase